MRDYSLRRKRKPQDITGLRVGRLIVVAPAERHVSGESQWLCACDCGNSKIIKNKYLRKGETTSCGCKVLEWAAHMGKNLAPEQPALRHGHAARTGGKKCSGTWHSWANMVRRCTDEKNHAYKNYGGRGITVCTSWASSFDAFLLDMGTRPPGLTLDRIDNNAGYCAENCRWADRKTQNLNRRSHAEVIADDMRQVA